MDEQDGVDLLLYMAQHAFNRKPGQELNELDLQDWMTEYQENYLKAATVLGLINCIEPVYKKYDVAWIAGSDRSGVIARLIDYFRMIAQKDITVRGETFILSGARELWVDLDGVMPEVRDKLFAAFLSKENLDNLDISLSATKDQTRIEEGKAYIASLALRSGITLDVTKPFIQYEKPEDCPVGRVVGRLYPNYARDEKRKLTESLMSQDQLAIMNQSSISIIDAPAAENGDRPNTEIVARHAAKKFIARIEKGDFGDKKHFFILLQSNQPYIERQTLVTQREVNRVLQVYGLDAKGYEITVEGVGFVCKEDIATVHSALGALMTEKWKTAMEGIIPKRDIKDLLFQTRLLFQSL